ncbi:MAG TPA: LPS assembly lipoprotein LptE [Gemmataceae bacterium]|nr:LPS assembly lipoprotein LptE [Gemmataceae bacterium]
MSRIALPLALVLLSAGCQNASVFGYRLGNESLYDPNIRTVYVPTFNNRAFQTTPYRGMEVDLTRAVVRELGEKTPFRVVSDPEKADTELIGNIVGIDKILVNRNLQNNIREGEIVVSVDVLWRDLRDGRILSAPRKGNPVPPGVVPAPAVPIPFDPNVPLPPPTAQVQLPLPTRIVASGRLLPELGETNASASKRVVDQIAVQIISMMEKPW